jgi:hypothetical protein
VPAEGIREMCTWEQFCRFAREPERRKVGIDARVTVDGTLYDVAPDLAGESVVLLWGLFDTELFIEHDGERSGPYLPSSGPIPLNRYRAFKRGKTDERADRIRALADQLGLPIAALTGAGVELRTVSPPVDVPRQPFDADLHEVRFASAIAAKLAIAAELGRPLATVSELDRAFIDDVLADTLIRRHVLQRVREHFRSSKEAEKRERDLRELVKKTRRPVVLFVDEAQDLNGNTLNGLKRLMEVVEDGGGLLSVVLVGQPRLRYGLGRPTMEEIGYRTDVFDFEGVAGVQRPYIEWLLDNCSQRDVEPDSILTEAAVDVFAEKLRTPLQIQWHLTRALEAGYEAGEKPVSVMVVESVLSRQLDDLEPTLKRLGFGVRDLAEQIDAKPTEIRALFDNQLDPTRATELRDRMLAAGLPV